MTVEFAGADAGVLVSGAEAEVVVSGADAEVVVSGADAGVVVSMTANKINILGIPIDRVPTSKSCLFCLGIKFLFFPI